MREGLQEGAGDAKLLIAVASNVLHLAGVSFVPAPLIEGVDPVATMQIDWRTTALSEPARNYEHGDHACNHAQELFHSSPPSNKL